MPAFTNADTIITWGYWRDETTWAGVKSGDQPATITFDPVPLGNATGTPNLRDISAAGWLKTRQRVARVDPTTGYFAALLVASNDPDLDAYGGRRVTFSGETPFTVEVPWNTTTVTADAAMVNALKTAMPDLTVGATVKAVPLINLGLTSPSPSPPASYLTTVQTLATITTAIDVHDTDPDAHADIRALASQGNVPDATTGTKGKSALMGGTAAAPTVPWSKVTGAPTSYPPSGGAGGVLSGTFPNPGFAVDMATQAELDAAVAAVPEQARDAVGAALVAGPNIAIAVNDAADTITVSATSPSGTSVPTRSVSASTTAVPGELLIVNATGGQRTVTPPASPVLGTFVTVLKSDSSSNVVVWDGPTNSDTSAGLVKQWSGATFTWTGTVWAVTATNPVSVGSNDRADHFGNQPASTISDLPETVQDIVGAFIVAGSGVTVAYDDTANTFTINAVGGGGGGSTDPEVVRDTIGAALVAGANVQITVNDPGDTITVAVTGLAPVATSGSATDLSTGTLSSSRLPATIANHSTATDNPHAVTKAQVGLGQVDNTSDADKPLSTAATTALAGKAPQLTQRATAATANTTAAANEIVPLDTTGGTFTLTGPTGATFWGWRWKAGTAANAPTIAAGAGYTINGAASLTPGLAPAGSSGELVVYELFGTDYQPVGGFKPQNALRADSDGRYAQVVPLAGAVGDGTTVDTAAINAVLSAAPAGAVVRGTPGKIYLIDAPLRLRQGGRQTLDMTGCTVVLKTGSNCNMLQNYAVQAVRRVLDAVTTASSTTITSATAAFVSGDVGKRVRIENAASGAVHDTTIASVTNSTTAVLTAAPTSTVAGEYMAIGARDADIRIVGGTWDRQSNGSSPTQDTFDAHSLRLRHVDGLVIERITHAATYGKYGVNPGDCTRVRTENLTFVSSSSDGVHFNGPCSQVVVRNILGDSLGDDIVSFTARDTFTIITDTAGDITDVVVDTVSYRTPQLATSSALKLVAGQNTDQTTNYKIANVKGRNLTGPCTQGVVCVGDNVPVGGNGGAFLDIDLESVKSLTGASGTQPVVRLRVGLMDRITLRDVAGKGTESALVAVGATVGSLIVSDCHWLSSTGNAAIYLLNGGGVTTLLVDNIIGALSATGAALVRQEANSSIGRLVVDRVSVAAAAGGANIIHQVTLPVTLTQVQLSKLQLSGVTSPLGDYRANVLLSADTVIATGMSQWLRARDTTSPAGTTTVTIIGVTGLSGDVDYYAPDTNSSVVLKPQSSVLQAAPDLLTGGEETYVRALTNQGNSPLLSSGTLWLTYFTARKTESVSNVRTATTTQAAATPTLCRIGIYAVAKNGDLTLVTSIASDTTLWAATNSRYTRALSAALAKVAGQRYAIGLLYVGTTAPLMCGTALGNATESGVAPRLCGSVGSLSDLPSTVSAGSVVDTVKLPYASLV